MSSASKFIHRKSTVEYTFSTLVMEATETISNSIDKDLCTTTAFECIDTFTTRKDHTIGNFKDLSTANPWMLPVFLDNIWLFKYVFSFFVLLTFLISFFIFPAQQLMTIRAVNISNFVQSSYQKPLFFGP